ncbi:ferritin-like domain-containing protein [Amycolatopsis sp. NPDC049691]|uniref:ferritin-like domain-containing protein n=1 Tax=Amycolatopsis sp. NPDC049691 TaxID=3155155 RepID=UPI0034370CB1
MGTVLAEEMIHLAPVANLLNAVGGAPKLDTPQLLPPYPHPLPHGDRSVHGGRAAADRRVPHDRPVLRRHRTP